MVKKTVLNGLMTAISLIIFMLESLIPPIAPIPGIKLGLANIVTLYAIYRISKKDAFFILTVRVFLASVFGGQAVSFLYSICGGILCLIIMSVTQNFFKEDKMWITSVLGAVGHNLGQIAVAAVIMQTKEIFYYLPFLMVSGMIAGAFTGNCCSFAVKYIDKALSKENL